MKNKAFFTLSLLEWNLSDNLRQMPWKFEKDPYKIWISEIILQQTRVLQGLAYYNRFITSYPDVHTLANASETEIYKHWEGLGYYTRCKNVIETAKYISGSLDGKFPETYEGIISLKGVGTYTASAIASFAFNLPYAVVDGNVYRVLSRFFGICESIDSINGKKIFSRLAEELLLRETPGVYNQAIMDFGALICKPKNPLCLVCPLQSKCYAYKKGLIPLFPYKQNRPVVRERLFFYLIIHYNDKLYIRKRPVGDIWENLYEFFLIESMPDKNVTQLIKSKKFITHFCGTDYKINSISETYTQKLTHQLIKGQFLDISITRPGVFENYNMVTKKALKSLPFPKFITAYLEDKNVSLNLLDEV